MQVPAFKLPACSRVTRHARAVPLPARASDSTLRLPGTYPHDAQLDYFRIAKNNRSTLFDTVTVIESNSLMP